MKVYCQKCRSWLKTEAHDDIYAGFLALQMHAPECLGDVTARFKEIVSGLSL